MLHVPSDRFSDYITGTWKRNLEWREFGGSFRHLRTSNSVVMIEEDKNSLAGPSSRFLTWRFGKSLEPNDTVLAYSMHCQVAATGSSVRMEWTQDGSSCHGAFDPESGVASLYFPSLTITYRLIGPDGAPSIRYSCFLPLIS